jgi:hypothetical protein
MIARLQWAVAYRDRARPFLKVFLETIFKKILKALACCKGLGFFVGYVYNTPIFQTLPLDLGVSNLPFLMELGDFIFFQILFFLNLEYTWTFISTVGVLV